MDMLTTLRRSGGIDALARKLNVLPPVAALGAEALLPAVFAGFKRRFQDGGKSDAGLDALRDYLRPFGGGDLAAVVMHPSPASGERGARLMLDMAGSPEAVVAMISDGQRRSGLDTQILTDLLPLLAMLVGGYLAARLNGTTAAAKVGAERVLALLTLDEAAIPLDSPASE